MGPHYEVCTSQTLNDVGGNHSMVGIDGRQSTIGVVRHQAIATAGGIRTIFMLHLGWCWVGVNLSLALFGVRLWWATGIGP